MASEVLRYKVWCSTDSKWESWYLPSTASAPTTCPTNTGHTIDSGLTSQITYVTSSDVELVTSDPFVPPAVAVGAATIVEQAHYVTHNFCDESTWYQKAIRVEDQACTVDGGDSKIYTLDTAPTTTIINAHMGYLNQEDVDPSVHKHKVHVMVDGVKKKVAGPSADTYPTVTNWDDYGYEVQVDWSNGDLQFKTDPSPGVVTMSYSCLDDTIPKSEQSAYCVEPPAGKKLKILKAEAQFSQGVNIKDSCIFTGFGPLTFQDIQTDDTLDPGSPATTGDRYRIDDASNLHANFGSIIHSATGDNVELGDGDIVEFDDQRGWGVIFDASEESSGVAVNPAVGYYTWNGSAWSGPGGPAVLSVVEAYGTRKTYKTLSDYLNEATGNYAEIPGGMVAGDRGNTQSILQIPWDWVGAKALKSSDYALIKVFLEHGVAFTGTDAFVTLTIYCQVYDDN